MTSAVHIRNLDKRFQTQEALASVSLDIAPGKLLALLGPSGCGKTTLLRCLAGLETADKGYLAVCGETVFDSEKGINRAPQERGIGFVFQDLGLWPHMSVLEHLLFVLGASRGREVSRQMAEQQLAALHIDHLAKKKPGQLSGGECQRLALARALVTKPRVLLMDEPLASLDSLVAREIRTLLGELKRAGQTTMIYVTHSRDEALELGDAIAVMKAGRVLQTGSPQSVHDCPRDAHVARLLGPCALVGGTRSEGGSHLETPLGSVPLTPQAMSMKNPLLVVREHQLHASAEGVPARIVATRFAGAGFIWQIEVAGCTMSMRASHQAGTGDEVQVGLGAAGWFVEGEET